MKKYLLIAAAAVAAFALVSCNKDDEAGGDAPAVEVFETTDATTVCINEVNGLDGYKGIELYNPTEQEVSLYGWKIIKNGGADPYWEGAENAKIAAKGFFVIKANKKTTEIDAVADAAGAGGLSASKGLKLELVNGELIVDTFNRGYDITAEDPEVQLPEAAGSMARVEDGKKTWKVMSATFHATNVGAEIKGDIVTKP